MTTSAAPVWDDAMIALVSPLGWANIVTRDDPQPVLLPRHIRYIDQHLRMLDAGGIETLVIQMAVQHGKSTSCSVWFPAWYLCRHPDASVGIVSYASDFAEDRFGRVTRNIVERAGKQWFGIAVDPASSARGRWNIAGRAGQLIAVGIDKGLTGRRTDLLVIDDPIQTLEQAASSTYRQMIWEKWQFEIATRLAPKARKICIMSRWFEDDFLGRMIKDLEDRREPYTLIDLPALALENDLLGRKPGEALWPEVRPAKWLGEQRDRVGGRAFDALFQGRPRPESGAVFKREWFRYYEFRNGAIHLMDEKGKVTLSYPPSVCVVFQMVDLATSTSAVADYTVVGTFAVCPRRELVVLDVHRERVPGPNQLALVRSLWTKWRATRIGIEAVAYQLAFVQTAIGRFAGAPDQARTGRVEGNACVRRRGEVRVGQHLSSTPSCLAG